MTTATAATTVTKAFFGNDYASLIQIRKTGAYKQFQGFQLTKGIPGLSVRDKKAEKMLFLHQARTKMFFAFDCELNMAKMQSQVTGLAGGDFIKFTPAERIVFGDGTYKTITSDSRNALLTSFFAQLDWAIAKYPNLYLLPLYVLPADIPPAINTPTTYSQVLSRYPGKALDLTNLFQQLDNFSGAALTLKGYITLLNIINAV